MSVLNKHVCSVPDCGYSTNDKSNINRHRKRHPASEGTFSEMPGVHSEIGSKRNRQTREDAGAAVVVSVPNNHVCSVLNCGYSTNDKSNSKQT